MTRLINVIIILLLQGTILYSQNYFDAEHSKEFAKYLFDTKQYALAADEFEKVTFLLQDDLDSRLNLIKSYRYNLQSDKALKRLTDFYPNLNNMPIQFSKEYLNNSLILNKYKEASNLLNSNLNFTHQEKLNYKLTLFILQKNWSEANNFYQTNETEPFNPELTTILKNKKNIKYKSPLLAGGLSTVLPGMGKVYTDRWKDGLISFIFVGANAWQAYRGFKKNGSKSAYGWIMGSIAFSFYIGNIYGSAKSAKKYNDRIDENFIHEAELSIYNNL